MYFEAGSPLYPPTATAPDAVAGGRKRAMFTITPKLAGLVAASAVALMTPTAFASIPHDGGGPTHKNTKAAFKTTKAAKRIKAAKSTKAPSTSTPAAVWSFPACTGTMEYDSYLYSGDPCTLMARPGDHLVVAVVLAPPTIESSVASNIAESRQGGVPCNGNVEYDYIFPGCF